MLQDERHSDIARRLLNNDDFLEYQEWLKEEFEKIKNQLADHAMSQEKTEKGTVDKHGGKLESLRWVINLPEYKRAVGNREEQQK